MSQQDKQKWNKKYQNNPIPNRPIALVTDHVALATQGKALDIACGMGRHSRYLASLGFSVEALDISSVAVENLQNIPNITAKEVDFDTYRLEKEAYNLIVCTYFLKRELFPQITEALKVGGVFIYETFLYHPDNQQAPSNRSFLLEAGELEASFSNDLELISLREYWDETMKGNKTMKASLVAIKR